MDIRELKKRVSDEMEQYDLFITLYYLFFIIGGIILLNPFIGFIYLMSFIYFRWFRIYSKEVYNSYILSGLIMYITLSIYIIFKDFKIETSTKLPWI